MVFTSANALTAVLDFIVGGGSFWALDMFVFSIRNNDSSEELASVVLREWLASDVLGLSMFGDGSETVGRGSAYVRLGSGSDGNAVGATAGELLERFDFIVGTVVAVST